LEVRVEAVDVEVERRVLLLMFLVLLIFLVVEEVLDGLVGGESVNRFWL